MAQSETHVPSDRGHTSPGQKTRRPPLVAGGPSLVAGGDRLGWGLLSPWGLKAEPTVSRSDERGGREAGLFDPPGRVSGNDFISNPPEYTIISLNKDIVASGLDYEKHRPQNISGMTRKRTSKRSSGGKSDGDPVDQPAPDEKASPAPEPFDPRKYNGYKCEDLLKGSIPSILFACPVRDKDTWGWRPRWVITETGDIILGRRELTLEMALAKTAWKLEEWSKTGRLPDKDF